MYRARIVFVYSAAFIFWLLLSGNLTLANILLGLLVCLATMLLFRGFLFSRTGKKISFLAYLKRTLIFLILLPIFFYQAYKSSLQVLRLVLSPRINLHQGIVRMPTRINNINGVTMLANLITLTPGTITVDIEEEDEEKYLYVHLLDIDIERRREIKQQVAGAFEPWIVKIFDRP